MIDLEKAQWADYIKVILKNGKVFEGSGDGILMAEDFDDKDYKFDTFYISTKDENIAIKIDEIKDIKFE
ncbi:hypothetical protein [Anaerococcus porci]|uniref:Uncharacterized protein n=1 Tax=Anaerococcus porci TaxID=2652269 RepID=A0A6N7VC88_9FIRM|nr:hypothetical protein [Anaerococcus porci]MDY3006009.1 hypothetical protein [Anaerococcus porci]MSS77058.1 hypothetical protein [Anaerococcus porci]